MQSSIVNRQSSIKSSVRTFARLSSALVISLAVFCESSFACDSVDSGTVSFAADKSKCDCVAVGGGVVGGIMRVKATGEESGTGSVTQCANASDTVCSTATLGSTSTASTQYYKHSSGYYKCDWTTGTGFSNGQVYTPTPATVNAPIDLHFSKQVESYSTEIELK